jgi:hypothetical protein
MSLKNNRYGASKRNGLTPGGKTNRSMTNLGTKTINKAANSNKKPQYTDSGQNYRDANNKGVLGTNVNEGALSPVIRKSPERPHVKVGEGSEFSGEKLYLGGNPRYDNIYKRKFESPYERLNKKSK